MKFEYNPQKEKDGVFKISPSSICEFNDKTHKWFEVKMLGEQLFEPNTGSITGTIVHQLLDDVINKRELTNYDDIVSFVRAQNEEYVNHDEVLESYPEMVGLGKDYILNNKVIMSEEYLRYELAPNIVLAGTVDAVVLSNKRESMHSNITSESITVIDWKTTAGGLPPKKLMQKHRWQLLCYALMLKEMGYDVTHIECVYISRSKAGLISEKTGKQLKSYPSLLTVITEEVTPDSLDFISSYVKLIAETCDYFFENPKLANILFKDQRLKNKSFEHIAEKYRKEKEEDAF